jgi:Ras-related protein Rab-32
MIVFGRAIPQLHKATTGVDFYLRKYDVDGVQALVQLWDIAGQDRFGSIYRVFYQHAFGAVVVFDVTEADTLKSTLRWKRQIDAKCRLPNDKPLPVWLCANKADLESKVKLEELDDFCKDNGFAGWLKTSAKTGTNVDESFTGLVRHILAHEDLFAAKAAADARIETDVVDLSAPEPDSAAGGTAAAAGSGKCC